MKRFIFDSIIEEENICNLEIEKQKIREGVQNGIKLLIYGKRNTGKTSMVKNVIAKEWLRRNSSGFFLYVDLMGVKHLTQISERMTVAFSDAYNDCFKMKSAFQNMLQIIKGIKPTFEFDDKGQLKLSFGITSEAKTRSFIDIIKQLDLIYKSNIPVLIVLDEFQDIASIDQAEALLRESLEKIDHHIPTLILGSKQHLLTQIFAKPNAPFFNWGTHISFETIDYKKYWLYINERLKKEGYQISFENSCYIQDSMSRIPEAINRLCYALLVQNLPKGEITKEQIDSGLSNLIDDRRAEPERYLAGFTTSEQKVIIAIAQQEPVKQPQGKKFVQSIKLTAPGVRKIIIKMENDAVIYKDKQGYILADPFLKQHIRRFRL